jgi:hypothetical protein
VDKPGDWGEVGLRSAGHLQGGRHGSQPAIDLALEGERADPSVEINQRPDFGGVGLATREHPLQRRGRPVVDLPGPLADALFLISFMTG